MYRLPWIACLVLATGLVIAGTRTGRAQGFGVELLNNLNPASGGMGGASLARPQDVQSALNGNPATMARFYGTQFSTVGSWIEPTFNMRHTGDVFRRIGPFDAKSEAEGSALGGFTVTQDLGALDIPATVGMGLLASSGAGMSLRDVEASNGTTATITVLQVLVGAGFDITDRLAVGANLMLGTGTLDGPFQGLTAAAYDYGLRGSVGLTYDVAHDTTLGLYYRTKQEFNFDDVVRVELADGQFTRVFDVDLDGPRNIGLGFATERLMGGRLLLAVDVQYINWDDADFWKVIYDDQWAVQLGAQYCVSERVRLRLGYAYAENATDRELGGALGGVPIGEAFIQYVQGQIPAINHHRLTGGVGIRDVLPGVDLDLFAGGMFRATEQFGTHTETDLQSYWVGTGLTWRFGRGACCRLPAPDTW